MSRDGRRSIPAPPLPGLSASKHTLVLGLGNPILGDDGVGWRVVEEAKRLAETGLLQRGVARSVVCDRMARTSGHREASPWDEATSSDGWDCFRAAALRNTCTHRQVRCDISSAVEFDCVSVGGLALMERLVGYDRALLVDAIQTRGGVPGTVYRLTLDDLPTLHADSAHDASLKAALALGCQLGARLPVEIAIYAIEATDVLDFSEILSPQVAASVGGAAEMVLAELASDKQRTANRG